MQLNKFFTKKMLGFLKQGDDDNTRKLIDLINNQIVQTAVLIYIVNL